MPLDSLLPAGLRQLPRRQTNHKKNELDQSRYLCILSIYRWQTSIVISQTDGRPMYLQIMEQIRQRVGMGEWKPGEQIPSIRALAIALQVSVITVKRAYLELEREGVIVTQHGKGSIVARGSPTWARASIDEEFEEHLRQVVADRNAAGDDRGRDRRETETRCRAIGNGGIMIDAAVEFSGVTKRYKHFTLDRIDLKLPTGCIMGFVGANGAGKSTTLRILMGLVHQDAGSVQVLGHAMPEQQATAKRDIGFVSEDMRLYGAANARVAYGLRAVDLPALG